MREQASKSPDTIVSSYLDRLLGRLIGKGKENKLLHFDGKRALSVTLPSPEALYERVVKHEETLTFRHEVARSDDLATFRLLRLFEAMEAPVSISLGDIGTTEITFREQERKLKNLRNRARRFLEDTGIHVLYLTFGFLHWMRGEREIKSPLVLVPVSLAQETVRHPYTLSRAHDDITVNSALSYYLEKECGILLPEYEEGEGAAALTQYLDTVEGMVSHLGWHVERSAALGENSFLKIAMHRDAEANRARLLRHPLLRAMARAEIPSAHPVLVAEEEPSAEECFHVLPTDSSQEELIRYARAGYSAVMIGPPGTGKSQTIANIIANAMADGKRVLFVSEKQAALQVVYQRLSEAGLADFCLPLHSHRAGRRAVINEIAGTLRLKEAPHRVSNLSLNELTELDACRTALAAYTEVLHRVVEPFGYSPYQIYEEYLSVADVPMLPAPRDVAALTHRAFVSDRALLSAYAEAREALGADVPTALLPYLGGEGIRFGEGEGASPYAAGADALAAFRSLAEKTPLRERAEQLSYDALCGLLTRLLPLLSDDASPIVLDGACCRTLREAVVRAPAQRERLAAMRAELLRFFRPSLLLEGETAFENAEATVDAVLPYLPTARRMTVATLSAACDALMNAKGWELRAREALLSIGNALECAFPFTEAGCDRALTAVQMLTDCGGRLGNTTDPALVAAIKRDAEICDEIKRYLLLFFTPEFLTISDPQGRLTRLRDAMREFGYTLRGGYRREVRELSVFLRDTDTARDGSFFAIALEKRVDYDAAARRLWEGKLRLAATLGADTSAEDDISDLLKLAASRTDALVSLLGGRVPDTLASGMTSRALAALESDAALLSEALSEGMRAAAKCALPSSRFFALGGVRACAAPLLALLTRVLRHASTDAGTVEGLLAGLRLLPDVCKAERDLAETEASLCAALGPLYRRDMPSDALLALLDRAAETAALADDPLLLAALKTPAARAALRASITTLFAFIEEKGSAIERLLSLLNAQGRALPMGELIALLRSSAPFLSNGTDAAVTYGQALARVQRAGLSEYVSLLERKELGTRACEIYVKAVLGAWFRMVCEREPALADFRESTHRRILTRFCSLDRKSHRIATARIRERLIEALPSVAVQRRGGGELGILMTEAGRGSKQMSLRRLFRAIPSLLPKLKPCFMMSPMSVAQFLNADDYHFDLVIFDEASQLFPEDAMGAILRADSVIVAGDPNQLPPSSFFLSKKEELDGEEIEEIPYEFLGDSILESALGVLPRFELLWHYRSRDERLIAFSNRYIYGSAPLITFPGNLKETDMGVEYVHVPDGVYSKGANVREAEACVRLVREHFDRHPNRSLGVIALGERQEAAIEEALYAFREENPAYEQFFREDAPTPFFIKNLESVQGDERDTILLSIGYARDPEGKFSMNFGPINWEGGHRRLNVAVTRAKYNVKLIGSILPTEIDEDRVKHEGVKLLRRYIEYAMGNESFTAVSDEAAVTPDSFATLVAETIRAAGYTVVRNLGTSAFRLDIAVCDPQGDGYLCAVLTDGEGYARAKTVRDRDHLRVSVLENAMGFPVYRVFSTEWMCRPTATADRLLAYLRALVEKTAPPTEAAAETESEASDEVLVEAPPAESDDPYGLAEYVMADVSGVPAFRPDDSAAVAAAVRYVLDAEAPMHISLLLDRLAPLFPGKKATAACVQAVRAALSRMGTEYRAPDGEGIIRATRGRRTEARRPAAGTHARSAVCMPVEEVMDCLVRILRVTPGEVTIDFAEMECVRALGLGSRRMQVRKLLSRARALLIARGMTAERDGGVKLLPLTPML